MKLFLTVAILSFASFSVYSQSITVSGYLERYECRESMINVLYFQEDYDCNTIACLEEAETKTNLSSKKQNLYLSCPFSMSGNWVIPTVKVWHGRGAGKVHGEYVCLSKAVHFLDSDQFCDTDGCIENFKRAWANSPFSSQRNVDITKISCPDTPSGNWRYPVLTYRLD